MVLTLWNLLKAEPKRWAESAARAASHPEECKVIDADRLPLQYCCRNAAPAEVIVAVVQAFPEAASQTSPAGNLPLHLCCIHAAPAEAIVEVLQAFPRAARVTDHCGWLALHHCCRHATPAEATVKVLQAFPGAARVTSPFGSLPIDDALASGAERDVMSKLLQEYPIWTDRMHGMLQDPKTGLPNAAAHHFKLKTMEGDALKVKDAETALIEIDLRNFKIVNDNLGHEAGDKALVAFAKQLKQWEKTYPGARAFRTGGDEFSVVLQEAKSGTCSAILKDITHYRSEHTGVVVSARALAFSMRGGWDESPWGFGSHAKWLGIQGAKPWLKAVEKVLHAEDHPIKTDRTVLGYPVEPSPSPRNRPVIWMEMDSSGRWQVWCGDPPLDEGSGFAQLFWGNPRAKLEQRRNAEPKLKGWKYWVD